MKKSLLVIKKIW